MHICRFAWAAAYRYVMMAVCTPMFTVITTWSVNGRRVLPISQGYAVDMQIGAPIGCYNLLHSYWKLSKHFLHIGVLIVVNSGMHNIFCFKARHQQEDFFIHSRNVLWSLSTFCFPIEINRCQTIMGWTVIPKHVSTSVIPLWKCGMELLILVSWTPMMVRVLSHIGAWEEASFKKKMKNSCVSVVIRFSTATNPVWFFSTSI